MMCGQCLRFAVMMIPAGEIARALVSALRVRLAHSLGGPREIGTSISLRKEVDVGATLKAPVRAPS
jgi:hypothetical protein